MSSLPVWAQELSAIGILLAVVILIISRLPKIDLGHSKALKRRRFLNWFPLGMTYAFLYMGRYNLTVAKTSLGDLMTKEDFGIIFGVGTVVYGLSFIINGPLTDRFGGRKTIMWAAAGAAVMNILMGVATYLLKGGDEALTKGVVPIYATLYAANMYFQSFGAVSIVKVNASWFHVRERGTFGGIFGILISLGIYFAFDWSGLILQVSDGATWWVFFVPAIILLVFLVIDYFLVFDSPSKTGHEDFDTADASSGDDGPRLSVFQIGKKMLTNPVVITIALIEFCSGFLRNAIMQWGKIFASETGLGSNFVFAHWGMMLCMAGILGGVFAGNVSDHLFNSRRGPVAAFLYGAMIVGACICFGVLSSPLIGWTVVFMSLCVIGVHGMLSGTASMDFGGRKNVGVAVGIIDGFVYLGTGLQAFVLGPILPIGEARSDPSNWHNWPTAMLPMAIIGFVLATRIWNAKPQPKNAKS